MYNGDLLQGLLDQQGVNSAVGTGVGGSSGPGFFSWNGFAGGKNADGTSTNGWGGAAMGLLQGLMSFGVGRDQFNLAKDQLQFSKDAFNKNYTAQAKMTNSTLEDRQRARVAANPGAYQSVGDYMAKNGIA